MKALILAAGYATRLYPITKYYPKSLLAVGTRPMIDHILDKLEDVRHIDEVIVVTNSKFLSIFKEWKRTVKSKKRITLVDDLTKSNETRRGAVGDIDFTIRKKKLRDDLLVIGGDNLFKQDLHGFAAFIKNKKNAPVIGVFDIRDKAHAKKYGVIKLDKHKKIVDFQEKPEKPKSTLIGMCLYYFPKETISLIDEYVHNHTDIRDATGSYIDWLSRGIPVYGYVFKSKWFDIGDFKSLDQASNVFAK